MELLVYSRWRLVSRDRGWEEIGTAMWGVGTVGLDREWLLFYAPSVISIIKNINLYTSIIMEFSILTGLNPQNCGEPQLRSY